MLLQAPLPQEGVSLSAEQTVPQAPQLLGSVCVLTLQPFMRLVVSQLAQPTWQVPASQEPLAQAATMLFVEHFIPQPPQLSLSVSVFTSQPSVCLFMSQSA